MRASDRLWAIGDVTGHVAFTHMSIYQARIAASDILGEKTAPADYRAVDRQQGIHQLVEDADRGVLNSNPGFRKNTCSTSHPAGREHRHW